MMQKESPCLETNVEKETDLLLFVRHYFQKNSVSAAHSLEMLPEEKAAEIISALPLEVTVEAVKHLENGFSARLLTRLPEDFFRRFVPRLSVEQGAALLPNLPEAKRQIFLACLDAKTQKQIRDFLTYPEDSAGRLMTSDFTAFHSDLTVREVVQKIRERAQKGSPASYAYVIDSRHCLLGVINMRDMILASENVTIESIMRKDVFSVSCFMDREKLAHELSRRKFFAVPVVDHENKLLGVVKVERLLGEMQEEATEDIQKMFGAGGDERAFSPVRFSLVKRLPWLFVNLATAFLAAAVVALFEDLIAKIAVLAVYLPVVAGQGGNAGAQSLAVVMRGLVLREISSAKAKKLILKETWIGAINGILLGLVTALATWLWHGNPFLGVVVGLGMLVTLLIAGFSGAAIPIFMKALGLDPAQCSNIILTTITDVMGFFAFLGFALLFQPYLL